MKWEENERNHYHECKTPIGRFEIVENYGDYMIYKDSVKLDAVKNLETAKEEVREHLQTLYYRLKIYLEINE